MDKLIKADAIGIPWYRRADYRRIREVMADGQSLPETFDKWQHRAEGVEREFRRRGATVVRAPLDPEDFVAWCAASDRDVDAEARLAWGNIAAYRHLSGEH